MKNAALTSPGFVSSVTIAEVVWIFSAFYKFDKGSIALVIRGLLHSQDLKLEHNPETRRALQLYTSTNCEHTYTFDKKATKLDSFEKA